MRRHAVLVVLGAALVASAAGCGESELDAWAGAASLARTADDTDPPLTRDLPTTALALDASSRVELTVPAVYRVMVRGEVSGGSRAVPFEAGAWVLVTAPYDAIGGSGNDTNIVDIGVKTDPDPSLGVSGALWFGTNTSIMADLGLPAIVSRADVDIVTERVDGDVVYADLIQQLAPINTLNIYNVDSGVGAQVNNILVGTVSVRFAPDGSAITGRVDLGGTSGMGGPTVSSEYHAALSGSRYPG
jgi:hypothetical protein